MLTETIIEDDRWAQAGLAGLAESAAKATLTYLGLPLDDVEIAVMGCDDVRIAALNTDFRGKPTPTNVLSWPTEDLSPDTAGAQPYPPQDFDLGNIALSFETCVKEAVRDGKTVNDHVTHLVVHGVLHLLGFDHIRDPDATLMEETERQILGKMGLSDPYS